MSYTFRKHIRASYNYDALELQRVKQQPKQAKKAIGGSYSEEEFEKFFANK